MSGVCQLVVSVLNLWSKVNVLQLVFGYEWNVSISCVHADLAMTLLEALRLVCAVTCLAEVSRIDILAI